MTVTSHRNQHQASSNKSPALSARPSTPQPTGGESRSELLAGVKQGVLIAAAVLAVVFPPHGLMGQRSLTALPAVYAQQPANELLAPRWADFAGRDASVEARFIANWVADSRDNRNMSFVIIDKKSTHVFVFDTNARLIDSTPVLLGAASGDDSVIGIGGRPMAEVRPEERTTPAGRFLGEPGRNTLGENVVWVDYEAAVSMHRVRATDPRERRLERLASPSTDDNRISYGCVNVPVRFFEDVLAPAFDARYSVVYVLPEVKALGEVFPAAYDPARRGSSAAAAVRKAA